MDAGLRAGSMGRCALVAALATVLLGTAFAVGSDTSEVSLGIKEVALIAVSGNAAASFDVSGLGLKGQLPKVEVVRNAPAFLQYTVIVPQGQTRSIVVRVDAPFPPGFSLTVLVGQPTGKGHVGTPVAGGVTIDSAYVPGTELTVLTEIGSCATGNRGSDGAPVLISLAVDDTAGNGQVTGDTLPDVSLFFTIRNW